MSEPSSTSSKSILHVWVLPFVVIFLAFFVFFLFFFCVDFATSDTHHSFLSFISGTDTNAAQNLLGSAPEVIAAVLGIAITVVAIIVELAANRYTARVTDLFIRDRVNFYVCTLFVVTTLQCLWTTATFRSDFVPIFEVRWTFILMTLSLLVLLPYFNYVFQFLQPSNIINRIRMQVLTSLEQTAGTSNPERLEQKKLEVMAAAEQITDIALNSIIQKDRGLAMNSTLVLRGLLIDVLALKPSMSESWYVISRGQRNNPDFVTLSEEGIRDVEESRTWLEFKIFRQFNLIFAQALNDLRDLNNLVAMCFREIGVAADRAGDAGALDLTVNFFNTILRTTLNGRDVRTAYNLLHQYKQLGSHLIQTNDTERVARLFRYFKYYGLLFDSRGMGFILETVAYDLHRLCREAAEAGLANEAELLGIFLEVDRPPDPGSSDLHLRGVRKAQAMLAAFYLERGQTTEAERIATDMTVEPLDRLESIRQEILHARRQFWEITDRGTNFDHLEEDLRPHLTEFFRRLDRRVREGLPATESGAGAPGAPTTPADDDAEAPAPAAAAGDARAAADEADPPDEAAAEGTTGDDSGDAGGAASEPELSESAAEAGPGEPEGPSGVPFDALESAGEPRDLSDSTVRQRSSGGLGRANEPGA